MTRKEINNILKTESGIILLEKESEQSFFEAIFSNWVSVLSALYFLTRKKLNSLILTENRIILIIRNKIYVERIFIGIESLNYNGNKSTLEVTDQNQKFSFPLNKLRITYEESKLIKQKLNEFMNRKK
ncbi:hypothetical protein IU405_11220 [Polaribacter sp. BAL334]|uniref:hypothetical protein n=1 Tax=Polaribacter sp. BAL334 TaxID=1708178 RepID=UPI0018D24367|nr:hypothetical protein [Polaribacter sp. BAL334]MBG7612816.1 hypothetical protein [Polaribacter sp. BAL334]